MSAVLAEAVRLDWLQGTVKGVPLLLLLGSRHGWQHAKPRHGYEKAVCDGEVTLMWSEGRDDVFACAVAEKAEVVKGWFWTWGFKATVVHLCVDTSELSVDELKRAELDGRLHGRHKAVWPVSKIVNGVESTETLYIGSRSSDSYTCVYDKGLQTGEAPAGTWTRIETRFRADHAQQAWLAYMDPEIANGSIINRVVRLVDLVASRIERCPIAEVWERIMSTGDRFAQRLSVRMSTVASRIKFAYRMAGVVAEALRLDTVKYLETLNEKINGTEKRTACPRWSGVGYVGYTQGCVPQT